MNEIHILIKENLQGSLVPPFDMKTQQEASSLQPGRGPSPEPNNAGTLILDFQCSEV